MRGSRLSGRQSATLTRGEFAEKQRAISAIMGDEFNSAARWLQPFMRNHSISFKILAAQDWSVEEFADKFNMRSIEAEYRQRGALRGGERRRDEE